MKIKIFLLLFLASLLSIFSFAQGDAARNSNQDVFTGSTPCDAFIRSQLKLPAKDSCDFMKWELIVDRNTGAFQIQIYWGISKPNTNGFEIPHKISVAGRFVVTAGWKGNLNRKIYHLTAGGFSSPVLLVAMDNNVLHLLDSNENFLTGNGGWGYMLNREK